MTRKRNKLLASCAIVRSNEHEDIYTYNYGPTPTLFIYHYVIFFSYISQSVYYLQPTQNDLSYSQHVTNKSNR